MSQWFDLVLVLHLFGALLLAAAIAVGLVFALLLRSAATVDEVRFAAALAKWLPKLFRAAGTLVLLTGIYLSVVLIMHHAAYGWIVVSLALVVAWSAWSAVSGKKKAAAIVQALRDSGGTMTPDLLNLTQAPAGVVHSMYSVVALLAIVVLMVYQPGVVNCILVLAGAAIVAAAFRGLILRRVSAPATSAA
ncbi:MAG TPA: DUF2269 family protein [Gammaproteobacteria bacterium]|nr:DUF2269 family protein [Gammaproteobacteria bacterium]